MFSIAASYLLFSFFPPIFHPSFLSCITCTDENGKDQGINIRQKVKEMVEFAQDDDRLREERKKAKKNKDKYIGVSSDSVGGFRYSEYWASLGNDWQSTFAFPDNTVWTLEGYLWVFRVSPGVCQIWL